MEELFSLKYAGVTINHDKRWGPIIEIISNKQENAHEDVQELAKEFAEDFTRSDCTLKFRIRINRCYVFSVYLYGCKS